MFQNFKIGFRLMLGFGLVLAIMISIAGIAVELGRQTSSAVAEMDRTSSIVVMVKNSLLSIRQARALTWYYLTTGDEQALKDRDEAYVAFAKTQADLEKLVISATGHKFVEDYRDAVFDFQKKATAVIALKANGTPIANPEFVKAIMEINGAQKTYVAASSKLSAWYEGQNSKGLAAAHDSLAQATTLSTVFGLIGVLAGSVLAWMISRGIARPVTAMTQAMRDIAGGDLSVDVPSRLNKDEIGAMAKAVQVFKENGLKLKETEAEAARQRQAADHERAANEATRAEIQRQQEAVVASIAEGLERLSKGDLTGRLSHAFSVEYEKLRSDFNATAESLQSALSTISIATDGISTGSDQIAHASDDLSRRTEQQAASLEETAAALNVITDTVKAMAANAGEAAKVVMATRGAAESSGVIVQQAVDAMGKIKDSSNQISNIIGVIDEIAFQTNLLALNAGVEAARAGDAGRGFAVVASEVRGLAQRSAEAAKEIKALISASTVQVESGVVLVDKTGVALKEIIAKVADMDGLVRQISTASQEQATGLAEINTAVGQMDQIVQQNAAMVEESTAAAHALKSETQGLTEMVGRFHIDKATRAPVVSRGNPVHAVQAKVAAGVSTMRRPAARPMMKTTAQKADAARQADWEEF